ETVLKQRGQVAESQRTTERLLGDEQKAQEKLAACDHAIGQAQQKRTTLHKTIAADQQRQIDLSARLRRLDGVHAQVKVREERRRELGRLEEELARLPADLGAELARTQKSYDELSGLAPVVPLLARIAQARDDLRQSRQREGQTAEAERTVKARGEQ